MTKKGAETCRRCGHPRYQHSRYHHGGIWRFCCYQCRGENMAVSCEDRRPVYALIVTGSPEFGAAWLSTEEARRLESEAIAEFSKAMAAIDIEAATLDEAIRIHKEGTDDAADEVGQEKEGIGWPLFGQ